MTPADLPVLVAGQALSILFLGALGLLGFALLKEITR